MNQYFPNKICSSGIFEIVSLCKGAERFVVQTQQKIRGAYELADILNN